MTIEIPEGCLGDDGTGKIGWIPAEGSKFRKLNAEELADLKKMAESTSPSFDGEHNAPWEDHHPVAREIWERHGLKPKGA